MHLPKFWAGGALFLLAGMLQASAQDPVAPDAQDQGADGAADEAAEAKPEHVFVTADKVIVRPGKVLEPGHVLVRDGVIIAVGQGLEAPEGATLLKGKVVCAAFLDPWSSLGLTSAARADRGSDAATRSVDGYDPSATLGPVREAAHAGVLNARVQVGARTAIGGLGALVSTVEGEMPLLSDAGVGANLTLGEDAIERIEDVDKLVGEIESGLKYDQSMVEYRSEMEAWEKEIADLEKKLEKDFKKAKKDRDKKVKEAKEKGKEHKDKSHKDPKRPRKPKYNPEDEVFARVATGEIPLVVHAERASVLRELLKGLKPFPSVRLVVAGGTQAMHVAEELAERRVPVIVYPNPEGARSMGVREGQGLALAAELDEAGVPVLIGSGGTTAARDLPLLAALAVGHGLDADKALAAITSGAARYLDCADQIGSVQRGRSADLLVLDGDPLSSTTRVEYALSAGRVVVAPKE